MIEISFVQETSRCQQQHQHHSLSHHLSHTPTHANKHNWERPFSHDYVTQISLLYGCCITAPSITHRCSDAHQGAASTSSNCLLISRAPLHLCISVSRLSGRAFGAPGALHASWRNRLNLSWVLCLRDSQRDAALHKATAPIDLLVTCSQRHVSGHVRPYGCTCGHF